MIERNFEEFKEDCLDVISELQEEFVRSKGIENYERWSYDGDVGVFQFKFHDGNILYFKYVNPGTFSTKDNTWLWSWANNSITRHEKKILIK